MTLEPFLGGSRRARDDWLYCHSGPVVIVVAGSLLRVKGLCATHDLLVRKGVLFSRSENILFVNFVHFKLWRFLNKLS